MTNMPWKANTFLTACIKLCGQNLRDWVIVSGSKTLHTICNGGNNKTSAVWSLRDSTFGNHKGTIYVWLHCLLLNPLKLPRPDCIAEENLWKSISSLDLCAVQWRGRVGVYSIGLRYLCMWVLGTASTTGTGGILDTGEDEGTSALALWHCHRRRWVGWLWRLCQTNWGKLRAHLNAWLNVEHQGWIAIAVTEPSTGRRCSFL